MYQRHYTSGPVGPVEGAILNGFSNMFGRNLRGAFEVGDRACDFQNAIVGAGTESLLSHGTLEQPLAVSGKLAIAADLLGPHLRVRVDTLLVHSEAIELHLARAHNTLADLRRAFRSLRLIAQLF